MAQSSLDLIDAMFDIVKAIQPVTGRGVGYKLLAANLIPSTATGEMQKVYRLLKIARERGIVPWEWIVDETHRQPGARIAALALVITTFLEALAPAASDVRHHARSRRAFASTKITTAILPVRLLRLWLVLRSRLARCP
jgi:hypothetical protein